MNKLHLYDRYDSLCGIAVKNNIRVIDDFQWLHWVYLPNTEKELYKDNICEICLQKVDLKLLADVMDGKDITYKSLLNSHTRIKC